MKFLAPALVAVVAAEPFKGLDFDNFKFDLGSVMNLKQEKAEMFANTFKIEKKVGDYSKICKKGPYYGKLPFQVALRWEGEDLVDEDVFELRFMDAKSSSSKTYSADESKGEKFMSITAACGVKDESVVVLGGGVSGTTAQVSLVWNQFKNMTAVWDTDDECGLGANNYTVPDANPYKRAVGPVSEHSCDIWDRGTSDLTSTLDNLGEWFANNQPDVIAVGNDNDDGAIWFDNGAFIGWDGDSVIGYIMPYEPSSELTGIFKNNNCGVAGEFKVQVPKGVEFCYMTNDDLAY